jgi:copper chaperone CopZ
LSDLASATLKLDGMHCAGCSLKIRKALESIEGVMKLEEGATKKHLVVTFDPAKTSTAALVKKVRDTGYDATVVD